MPKRPPPQIIFILCCGFFLESLVMLHFLSLGHQVFSAHFNCYLSSRTFLFSSSFFYKPFEITPKNMARQNWKTVQLHTEKSAAQKYYVMPGRFPPASCIPIVYFLYFFFVPWHIRPPKTNVQSPLWYCFNKAFASVKGLFAIYPLRPPKN